MKNTISFGKGGGGVLPPRMRTGGRKARRVWHASPLGIKAAPLFSECARGVPAKFELGRGNRTLPALTACLPACLPPPEVESLLSIFVFYSPLPEPFLHVSFLLLSYSWRVYLSLPAAWSAPWTSLLVCFPVNLCSFFARVFLFIYLFPTISARQKCGGGDFLYLGVLFFLFLFLRDAHLHTHFTLLFFLFLPLSDAV